MSSRRSCRLIIKDILFSHAFDSLSAHSLIIKQANEMIIKSVRVDSCKQLKFHVESEGRLSLCFGVTKDQAEEEWAQGLLVLQFTHIGADQLCNVNCSLTDKYSHQQFAVLKIEVSFDDEKVSYNLAPKDSDYQDTEQWPEKSKLGQNSLTKVSGKMTRKRRHAYLIKDEHPRIKVNNKIFSNKNVLIKNMAVKLQNKTETITFKDKQTQQFIAEVKCFGNPSPEQLRRCEIKVPAEFSQIQIELKFVDNSIAHGSLFFSFITDEESRSVNIPLYDDQNVFQGNFNLTYHYCANEQVANNQERLSLNTEQLQNQSSLIRPHLLKYLQNLQGARPQGHKHTAQLLAQQHRIPINRSTLVSKTVDQKIMPSHMSSLQRDSRVRNRIIADSSLEQFSPEEVGRLYADKLRHMNSYTDRDQIEKLLRYQYRREMKQRSPKAKTHRIRISSVLINLYSIYFVKHKIKIERDASVGKFLNIYSNNSHVYRSDQIFATQTLAWKLKPCQIQIKEIGTLTVQLCLSKDKSVIGQSISTYQQLLAGLTFNNYFKGRLFYDSEEIGQIILNYKIIAFDSYNLTPSARAEDFQIKQRQQMNRIKKGCLIKGVFTTMRTKSTLRISGDSIALNECPLDIAHWNRFLKQKEGKKNLFSFVPEFTDLKPLAH